jgi:hypothetical protein
MTFLLPFLQYFAGWLLQYGEGVEVLSGDELRPIIKSLLDDLSNDWGK